MEFQSDSESVASVQPPVIEKKNGIGKTFRFIEKIDAGSFGEIYHAKDLETDTNVAIKLEKTDSKQKLLCYEAKILQFINNRKDCIGYPKVYYCSTEEPYNVMVTELLGPSLEDLFNICGRKFSAKSVALIGLQLIERLEFLHKCYYIHRDIKPDNVCIGLGKNSKTLYLIDFAFSKRFIQKDGSHIPFQEGKLFTGTARYASINAQKYFEQSRRDDLISLGYSLVYLMRGRLPWQDYRVLQKKEKYEKILEKKQNLSLEQLCAKLPEELFEYMKYCTSLEFEQKPDYIYIKNLFSEMLKKYNLDKNEDFDWNIVAQEVEY
ncbi:hypothetical protein ABPG72_007428 [Tetrahymena utriculariae]